MDMIRTASHVHGNVAVTAFVCDKEVETGGQT
jgi:Na+/H+-dicarboxylate symporter